MKPLTRRQFLTSASATIVAGAIAPAFAAHATHSRKAGSLSPTATKRKRVFVGCGAEKGVVAFHWDPGTAELIEIGPAAEIDHVSWIAAGFMNEFLYMASSTAEFNGKKTGKVASYRLLHGELQAVSAANSAGLGTCHVALDRTGRVLLAADYTGGSAASFRVKAGVLGEAVWTEHYREHGPNTDRQDSAHAHFCSFSPDNRYAYINDLGGDSIHIYKLNVATADLTPAGIYRSAAGAGPRTLHFHANNRIAYSVNELNSTVDVLEWSKADGGLRLVNRINLLPEGYAGPTRACDLIATKDWRFVYFANRDNNFLHSFKVDPHSGELEPMRRSNCGGKTPRNLVLDPSEQWMFVANQDSNWISVIKRNPDSGELAEECKNYPVEAPMRVLFT